MPRKRVVYGNANYADLVQKGGYFVDKTPYIAKLELVENPVYLRPRRFGKSTFCSLLNYYYDLNQAAVVAMRYHSASPLAESVRWLPPVVHRRTRR